MSKFIFISYKKLNYLILFSFFSVVIFILGYSFIRLIAPSHSILTYSSIIKNYKSFNIDTDGNGRNDIMDISIDTATKEYRVEIISDSGKKFILSPGSNTTSIGPYVPWWPLKVTVADINMDSVPEIITQVSKSAGTPPLYIFRWNGREYKCVLSGLYEGINIADTDGDGIPEIICTEKVPGTGEVYTTHFWAARSYRKTNTQLNSSLRGYDKIQSVIRYMSSPFDKKLPESDELHLYFTDSFINENKNIDYLNNFSRDVIGIQLQDYIGEELSPGSGNPVRDLWRLRYIVFRKYGTEVRLENYTAEIETEQSEGSGQYKIKSMSFKAIQ